MSGIVIGNHRKPLLPNGPANFCAGEKLGYKIYGGIREGNDILHLFQLTREGQVQQAELAIKDRKGKVIASEKFFTSKDYVVVFFQEGVPQQVWLDKSKANCQLKLDNQPIEGDIKPFIYQDLLQLETARVCHYFQQKCKQHLFPEQNVTYPKLDIFTYIRM